MRSGYASVTSARFRGRVREALGDAAIETGVDVETVEPTRVRCADGRTIEAGAVLDGAARASTRTCGSAGRSSSASS